jgi:purine-binding chemotaxis protein CheW
MDMTDIRQFLLGQSAASASHYVVVGIGCETFGVPAGQIQEIIGLRDLEAIPSLPKRFTGPVRILGKVISLVKLQAPFVRAPGQFEVTSRTGILILKAPSSISSKIPKGVVVDRIDHFFELGEDDVETINTQRKGFWPVYTLGFAKRHLPVVLIDLQRLVMAESAQNNPIASRSAEPGTSQHKRRSQK